MVKCPTSISSWWPDPNTAACEPEEAEAQFPHSSHRHSDYRLRWRKVPTERISTARNDDTVRRETGIEGISTATGKPS